jgi:hypothetical protein
MTNILKQTSLIILILYSAIIFGQDFSMDVLPYPIDIDSTCIKGVHFNPSWYDSTFSNNIDTLLNLLGSPSGLKLINIIKKEEELNSKNISPDYFIDIGKGIYPNKKGYQLSKNVIYQRHECPYFQIDVNYYSTPDSLIRVVMFEWNEFTGNGNITIDPLKKNDIFQTKFYRIENIISSRLGKYKHKSIPRQRKKKTYRSDYKWKSKEGLNAYLFMFSNKANNYQQIRLAIYKD